MLDDPKRIAKHEGARDLHAGAADDPVEGLARHAHAGGGDSVKEIFDVGESEGFQFIGGEDDLLEFVKRDARGLEEIAGRLVGNAAGADGAGHGARKEGLQRLCYGHKPITRDDNHEVPQGGAAPRSARLASVMPPRQRMKLALPLTATDEFSPHYGAATKFAVMEVDPGTRTVRRRLVVVPQDSEPCQWPQLLRAAGVDLVLAGGMGRGARQHMAEHGVQVLAGVAAADPETLVAAWLAGTLVTGENQCDGSHRHAHGHDHGESHDHQSGCGCAH